jgi:predicted deacylase
LVTISSTDKITKNEENLEDKIMFPCKNRPKSFATQKKAIFFSARVHPGEVPGSHVMNGILKGLLQDTDIAKLLRDKFVFYMVPIINPDGVFRGHYRTDRNGVNLNRYYMSPSPKDHSPIYAIKKFVLHLHYTGRLFACMDMHAHATRKGTFIYGNYSTELKKQL